MTLLASCWEPGVALPPCSLILYPEPGSAVQAFAHPVLWVRILSFGADGPVPWPGARVDLPTGCPGWRSAAGAPWWFPSQARGIHSASIIIQFTRTVQNQTAREDPPRALSPQAAAMSVLPVPPHGLPGVAANRDSAATRVIR